MFKRRGGRKQATHELDPLREQLRSLSDLAEVRGRILSSIPEGIILLEADGTVGFANPAAARLLAADPAIAKTLLEGGTPEFSLHHPASRHYRSTVVDMDAYRRVAIIQDVTDARRLEAMRRDLVGDVSHELKTPVAGILAAAETLEISIREDPESSARFVASLLREAQRLSRLVEDLLDLARVEQQHPAGRELALAPLIRKEIGQVSALAKSKRLEIRTELDDDLVVLGHEEDLALAIRNLLMNAMRYTESGGTTVRLIRKDGQVELSVTDTGIGIPNKDLPRIFERFYRVDRARSRETGGTGLGLSIVKHVAERHGGRVTATSSLGEGSVFTIILPSPRAHEPEARPWADARTRTSD